MSDNNFIPNSYQTPNIMVDKLMPYLTPSEWVVLSYAMRHIIGFHDRLSHRTRHMSLNMFVNGYGSYNGCGLGKQAVRTALDKLSEYGLLQKIGEPTSDGQLWKLVIDEGEIKYDDMEKRLQEQQIKDENRMEIARAKIGQKDSPILTDSTPPILADSIPPLLADSHKETHLENTPNKQTNIADNQKAIISASIENEGSIHADSIDMADDNVIEWARRVIGIENCVNCKNHPTGFCDKCVAKLRMLLNAPQMASANVIDIAAQEYEIRYDISDQLDNRVPEIPGKISLATYRANVLNVRAQLDELAGRVEKELSGVRPDIKSIGAYFVNSVGYSGFHCSICDNVLGCDYAYVKVLKRAICEDCFCELETLEADGRKVSVSPFSPCEPFVNCYYCNDGDGLCLECRNKLSGSENPISNLAANPKSVWQKYYGRNDRPVDYRCDGCKKNFIADSYWLNNNTGRALCEVCFNSENKEQSEDAFWNDYYPDTTYAACAICGIENTLQDGICLGCSRKSNGVADLSANQTPSLTIVELDNQILVSSGGTGWDATPVPAMDAAKHVCAGKCGNGCKCSKSTAKSDSSDFDSEQVETPIAAKKGAKKQKAVKENKSGHRELFAAISSALPGNPKERAKSANSVIGKAATELLEVGAKPEEMATLYQYCSKRFKSEVSAMCMAKYYAEYKASDFYTFHLAEMKYQSEQVIEPSVPIPSGNIILSDEEVAELERKVFGKINMNLEELE